MAVSAMGFCFSLAVLAAKAGFSLAMGAFLAGMLVSESGEGKHLEQLLMPFRDVFAAIFFVSVGMQLDPRLLPGLWSPILTFALLVMVGKAVAVTLASAAARIPLRTGIEAGLALAQIGEFSFIIAATGLAHGAVKPELFAVAVGTSILTSLATPTLLGLGPTLGARVEARLPAAWRRRWEGRRE